MQQYPISKDRPFVQRDVGVECAVFAQLATSQDLHSSVQSASLPNLAIGADTHPSLDAHVFSNFRRRVDGCHRMDATELNRMGRTQMLDDLDKGRVQIGHD